MIPRIYGLWCARRRPFRSPDLNDLYRRVINRNNRLKNLLMLKTPDVIIHQTSMLRNVDALLDNSATVGGSRLGNRLESLSDMLSDKVSDNFWETCGLLPLGNFIGPEYR